jgi:D-alanyl-D-alanine carboxypeptidase
MRHRGISAFARQFVPACFGIIIALATIPLSSAWAQSVSRYSAIVVDASNGNILMGTNPDELRFPASLTKLMTLYMTFEALRDRRVQLTQYVPVSAWAAEQPPSKLGIQPGEALTVEQAILALVTKSANDVAAALGEFLGGSEDRFAQMMTLRARALGMNRTNFRNASGLPDPYQWSTARDLATLSRRIVLDFPQFYPYFSVPGFMFHDRLVLNHDSMLRSYPGADGMKTGYTENAGHNLITSAVHGNVRLIGVVLGTSSNMERDRYMTTLLDDSFNRLNAPTFRFNNPFIAVANAATTTLSVRATTPPPTLPQVTMPQVALTQVAPPPRVDAERSVPPQFDGARSIPAARVTHDRAVQIGAFPAERVAWEVAQEGARMMPAGLPRVQPVAHGRRTVYHAQLLGLSEGEARTVCADLSRRVPSCQVFRINAGQTAFR